MQCHVIVFGHQVFGDFQFNLGNIKGGINHMNFTREGGVAHLSALKFDFQNPAVLGIGVALYKSESIR